MGFTISRTVSAVAAVDLANELMVRSFLDEQALRAISSTLFALYTKHANGESIIEQRVSESDLLLLWQIADSQSTCTSLGFEIGLTVNFQAKGLLANWLSCCETLREAFNIFHQNIALLNQAESWSISESPKVVRLSFQLNAAPYSACDYPVMAVERSMVALIAWANVFTGARLTILAASFAFKRPAHADQYPAVFGPDIRFDNKENYLEIAAEQFDSKLQSANPYLRNLLEERSGSLSLSLSGPASTKATVNTLLRQDLPRYCHLNQLLKALHMSRATLYRKLKDEECSFTDLLLQERLHQLSKIDSKRLNLCTEDISEALGFSDVSSFYKFMKRQTTKSE